MPFADRPAFNFGQLKVLRVTSRGGAPASQDRLELDFNGWAHGGRWAVQLDTALGRPGDPTLIVAQGVACLAVAWWAQLSPKSYIERVAGAVFLSPLSFSPSEAPVARSLRPSPGTRLPFPSIVTSHASPIIQQVLDLADTWGSQFVDADASAEVARRTLLGHPLVYEPHLMELIDASWVLPAPAALVEPTILPGVDLLATTRK